MQLSSIAINALGVETHAARPVSTKPAKTHPVLQVKENGIVLFAYPKANTKGCTSQAVGLSEKAEELAAAGYKVLLGWFAANQHTTQLLQGTL